jgi:hypothetical protein
MGTNHGFNFAALLEKITNLTQHSSKERQLFTNTNMYTGRIIFITHHIKQ